MSSPESRSGARAGLLAEWEEVRRVQDRPGKGTVEAFLARLKARDVEKELASAGGATGGGGEERTGEWFQAKMKDAQERMAAKMQAGVPFTDPQVQEAMAEMQRYQQEYVKMVSDPASAQKMAAQKKGDADAVAREKRWTAMMIANAELKLARLSAGAGAAGGPASRDELPGNLDTDVPPGTSPAWWVRVPLWMVRAKDINDPEEVPEDMEQEPDGWVSVLLEPAPASVVPSAGEYYKARERDPVPTKYCEPRFVFKVTIRNDSAVPVELGTLDEDWFTAFSVDDAKQPITPWSGYDCTPGFVLGPRMGDRTLPPHGSIVRFIGFADQPLGAAAFPPERLAQIYLSIRRRQTYMNEFRRTVPAAPPPPGVEVPAKVVLELKTQEFRDGKTWDTSLGRNVRHLFIPARRWVRTSLPQGDGIRTFVTDRDLFVPLRVGRARVRATCTESGPIGLVDAVTVTACDITHVEQVTNPEPAYFEHEGPRKRTGAAAGGVPREVWRLDGVGVRPVGASRDLGSVALGTSKGFRILDGEGYGRAEVELRDPPKTVSVSGTGDLVVVGSRRTVAAYDPDGKPLWTVELKKDVAAVCVSGDGARVYATCRDDDLHLLARDGKTVWSKSIANADGPFGTGRTGDRLLVRTTKAYLVLEGDGRELWKFDQSYHGEYPASAAMAEDGALMAVGSDRAVYLFDGGGKELAKLDAEKVKSCAVAGDGSAAAYSDWGGNTFVVDRTGAHRARFQTGNGERTVALGQDGRSLLLLSGGVLARYSI